MEYLLSFFVSWILRKVLSLVITYISSYVFNKKRNKTEGEKKSRVMAFFQSVLEGQFIKYLKELDLDSILELLGELLM